MFLGLKLGQRLLRCRDRLGVRLCCGVGSLGGRFLGRRLGVL